LRYLSDSSDNAPEPLRADMVSQKVLHYQLLEKIGAGGMGEIYKAQDSRLNRSVAVKILSPNLSADPERRRRFFQEAQAASALNHPNIITLHDIVSEGDLQCIVMEFIAGKTLRELIPAGGLPVPQALQYGIQIASALAAAHAAGIVHRDLKPSNIMVTSTGLVKVLDFGLAKWVDVGSSSQNGELQSTVEAALTREGSIIGTVSYMSPEQAEGKHVDARSDIFSFGDVLYEMVTGRRAFEGRSGISTLSSILRDDVKPIADAAPDVPQPLEEIILRCLPKDPAARWQSMKEIESALTVLQRRLDPMGQFAPPVPSFSVPGSSAEETSPVVWRPAALREDDTSPGGPPRVDPDASSTAVLPAPAGTGPGAKAVVSGESKKAKPAAASKAHSAKFMVILLFLIGAVLLASAGIGGWWWWKTRKPVQPDRSLASVMPTHAPSPVPPPAAPLTPETTTPPAAPAETEHKPVRKRRNKPADKIVAPIPSAPVPAVTTPPAIVPPPAVTPPPSPAPKVAVIPTTPVAVSDALPFMIVLAKDVPSDEPEGYVLTFTARDGLKVGDKTVIAKGATVTGEVTGESSKKGFLGIHGGHKMMFRLLQATAVDGKKIAVRALPARNGEGQTIRSFETAKGAKTKGFDARQGSMYVAYVDGDQIVAARK
jgi:serine/threonine protein kinase